MLASVSTVKDTVRNVSRFVERNLAGGIDHMFVFVDAPDAECERYLGDHPHVTPILATETWWNGARPEGLNRRKIINANVVKALLTDYEWASWLFHIDADEIVRIELKKRWRSFGNGSSARAAPVMSCRPGGKAAAMRASESGSRWIRNGNADSGQITWVTSAIPERSGAAARSLSSM